MFEAFSKKERSEWQCTACEREIEGELEQMIARITSRGHAHFRCVYPESKFPTLAGKLALARGSMERLRVLAPNLAKFFY